MKRSSLLPLPLMVLTLLFVNAVDAQRAPAWLEQAAALPTPAFTMKNVPAVVLRSEQSITISPDGTVVRTVRHAVRVLEREGRIEAVARVIYRTDSDKVRDLNAWLIKRAGEPRSFGKKETIDAALMDNDLFNEARRRYINASGEAEVGDVFGYETTTEEKRIFSQFQHFFQDDIPVINSRFVLKMPAGWRADSVTFNAAKVEPVVAADTYTWEMRDLKPISPEPRSPRFMSLVPRLAVSVFPDQAAVTRMKTFANWNEVAKWMSEIEDPQMTVNDAMAAKTQELTAGAKTEFEKIQAISRYVQQIQYVSIQVGTGRGGGYTPRSATDVFAKAYGDCKDKANLMRAMLSLINIPAYMVSITADDPSFVRAEWASPHQFNHCIIAVKIGDSTVAESVVTHPSLGRLLIFDPTDPYTPIGDLPEDQQGSLALIDHKDTTELITMPTMSADANKVDRQVEAVLGSDGSIFGKVTEKTIGQSARRERAQLKGLSAADYNRVIERWISRGATGAKTSRIEPRDNHAEGKFDLAVEFSANGYAQVMQQRLMVFKPAIVGRLDRLSFNDGVRSNPYMIDASAYSESVTIKLPEGFEVDEMPEAVKLETEFGRFEATYKIVGGHLVFNRSMKLNRATIPANKYETVKSFFGRVHAADQSPVVLLKK